MANLARSVNGRTRTVDMRDPNKLLRLVPRNMLSATGAAFVHGLGRRGACIGLVRATRA